LCLLIAPFFSSQANDANMPVYFTFDAGANLMGKVQHPSTDLTLSMETGARFDAAVGYNFFRSDVVNVGADLETGFIYNGINHGTIDGELVSASGYLIQVPLLVNARVQLIPSSNWNPYVAIGGGAIRSTLTFDWFHSAEEIQPAFQAAAGLTYDAGDTISVGIGYKYLVTFPEDLRRGTNHAALIVVGLNY
jgi:opacity protein-like surface antigen